MGTIKGQQQAWRPLLNLWILSLKSWRQFFLITDPLYGKHLVQTFHVAFRIPGGMYNTCPPCTSFLPFVSPIFGKIDNKYIGVYGIILYRSMPHCP